LKEPSNLLFLIGMTRNEMGGSHFNLVNGLEGGEPPRLDLKLAPQVFRKLHEAIQKGLIRSCHDLSEGGLAVAIAEMCFAGGWGADIEGDLVTAAGEGKLDLEVALYAESNTRFLIEVTSENEKELSSLLAGIPFQRIGAVSENPQLNITNSGKKESTISVPVTALQEAWQEPLRW
jgi:phosphoribosylformylglycinamidine synthase subunit PurSL